MNKRTASKLQSVTEFWNEWQLRLFVSFSLFLQIMLGVLGSRRKYTSRNWLRYILWLAYSLAYRIAAVSIGIISNDLGCCDNPSQQIRAFWAPFLLLHLGGPDTITAYSSEDNALDKRYFLGLFTHFVGAVYIFLGSWKATPLNILAILMFKAGLIKYLDRTLYLMSRSNARFTKSVIRWLRDKGDDDDSDDDSSGGDDSGGGDDGGCCDSGGGDDSGCCDSGGSDDSGGGDGCDNGGSCDDGGGSDEDDDGDEEPGDAAFMAAYYFKKAEGCHVSCQPEIKKPEVVIIPCPAPRNKSIPEAAILRKANKFFPKFKPLFANLGLESTVLRESKSCFQNLSWTEAFEVTEIELGFLYDIFYTNAADNKRGVLSRFICLCLTISTFMGFSIIDKHEYPTIDVIITCIKAAKKLCALKGEWALEKMKCCCRLSWSIGEEFDENILLWHVATEICYYTDLNKNSIPVKNPNREASKLLSDYLLHLLVKRPHVLPNGIGQIRFQDSSADATEFFSEWKAYKR